jgi:hypothetical protein
MELERERIIPGRVLALFFGNWRSHGLVTLGDDYVRVHRAEGGSVTGQFGRDRHQHHTTRLHLDQYLLLYYIPMLCYSILVGCSILAFPFGSVLGCCFSLSSG